MLLPQGLHVSAATLKQVNHALIGSSIFIRDVASNTSLNHAIVFVSESRLSVDRLHFLVFILVSVQLNVLSNPNVSDLHLVESEGASLVRTDVGCTTHDLAGGKFLDVVLILEHLTLGVSERDHNGERETFGNSNNDNGNTNNEVVNPLFEVLGEGAII